MHNIVLAIIISISIIFADTVNASENSGIDEVKTLGLNLLVPGLGFYVIRDDFVTAVTVFGFYSVGIATLVYYDKFYKGEKTWGNGMGVAAFSGLTLSIGVMCNIFGSFTDMCSFEYKSKSENSSYHKNEGLNMAILPNNHGNFKAYLLYNKAF